jgi:hypothetical protein
MLLSKRFVDTIVGASLATVVLTAGFTARADEGGVNAGVLTCVVEGGVGMIIFSSKEMNCEFDSVTGRRDIYTGTVKKFGLDVGITGKTYVKWVVFAPVGRPREGRLAGTYVGVSGEASAGAGVGANGLIGGSERSFSMQPFSASVGTGVNLALGIGSMTLESVN